MSNFIKEILRPVWSKLQILSLKSAIKEQKLDKLVERLTDIVPDLTDQYTMFVVEGEFLRLKVRACHAFQIDLTQHAVSMLKKDKYTIVDIGDSSGTHLKYLESIYSGNSIDTISVNLDKKAVTRIIDKGMKAIECRAEELHKHPDFTSNSVDIFLSFEMVEHLMDPVTFMHNMAIESECKYFVVTVPYLYRSRVGLHHVRAGKERLPDYFVAENTHIFELSPDDWDLIFKFSGWKIVKSVKYTQYPTKNPLSLLKWGWRRMDFDGFYGVILEKDDTYSKRYKDW
jgi:hypothetical protein